MRCKVGDIAILVRALRPENVGLVVTVVDFDSVDPIYGPVWVTSCETPKPTAFFNGVPAPDCRLVACSPDAWLRPIRDPGEDARDETLIWKSVPSSSKEAA